MAHDHNHDHEERELITLVDEQGNETLFEILLTIDGKRRIWKELCPFDPCKCRKKMKTAKLKSKLIHLQKTKTEQKATFNQSQKTQDAEWDMIEEVFNSFMEE